MSDNFQRPKGKPEALSALNLAIDDVDLTKELARTKLARAVFGTVAFLLIMIRVSFPPFRSWTVRVYAHDQDTMINERDYIDLGLSCAHICEALERGMGTKKLRDLDKSVCDAMNKLITRVQPRCTSPALPLIVFPAVAPSRPYKRRLWDEASIIGPPDSSV